MTLNLLTDPWLPVIRYSGRRDVIRPAQITEGVAEDPVVDFDWPRPDFRFASLELLIGLLATACPPTGHDAWLDGWDSPPQPAALDAAFEAVSFAFNLDDAGPCFLQDLEDLASESEPIERLLIESPGGNTVRNNADLLVRRGRFSALGRPTAAIALYTFQSWAPSGGAGNRTGLRGGGPLITMVAPGATRTLWHLLWANVPEGEKPASEELPRVFPWLAPTLTSEAGQVVTPEAGAHPLQCWWGMPRRIRLDFSNADPSAPCEMTGTPDSVLVTGWRQRPRGANYAAWGGQHPLTPHYRLKPGGELLAVHPQPGGIGYRNWLGLVSDSSDGLRVRAAAVGTWRHTSRRAKDVGTRTRLLAAGYDMDNMKARGFVESEMPMPGSADERVQDAQDAFAAALVRAADQVASLLRSAVRNALFSPGATVKPDAELLATQRERLWSRTEQPFFEALSRVADGGALTELQAEWQRLLRDTALSLFDEASPLSPERIASGAAIRIAAARRRLLFAVSGFGKEGGLLFQTLSLPAAEPKAKRKGKSA